MPTFEFATAARILFGEGTLQQVPAAAAAMGRRALLVTGATADRAAPLEKALAAAQVSTVRLAVAGEPTLELIRSAPQLRSDLIEAGSRMIATRTIDAEARRVALFLSNGGRVP